MKICFGLNLDFRAHNYARRLAFDINREYNTGFIAARLPQHITLGPLFEVNNINEVESLFDELAENTQPFDVVLNDIELRFINENNNREGILWFNILESDELKELYEKIYNRISNSSCKFDLIDKYQFHSTIALGSQPDYVYEELFKSINNKEINIRCNIKEIAIFCPEDNENNRGNYVTYKILPLFGYKQYICL